MDDLIISVFYEIDNFCKKFIPYMEQQCIQIDDKPVSLELPSRLTLSEAMTICAAFHLSRYRTFKWFYKKVVLQETGFKGLQEILSKSCKLPPFCGAYAIYCTSDGVFCLFTWR